jgi:hypothetical protein
MSDSDRGIRLRVEPQSAEDRSEEHSGFTASGSATIDRTHSARTQGAVLLPAAVSRKGDVLVLALSGTWELERPTPRFDRLVEEQPGTEGVRAIEFDATELGAWDSSLLTFLLQGLNHC